MIRLIQPPEFQQSQQLRDYVFRHSYTPEKQQDYLNWLSWGQGIGAFEGTRLVGQVINLPITLNLFDQRISAVGINHVGVYPENRGGGLATKLMTAALQEAYRRQQVLAVLEPFSVQFYRHLGFDLFTERVAYTIPAEKFPSVPVISGTAVTVRHYTSSDLSAQQWQQIHILYSKTAAKISGMQYRDVHWWQRLAAREPARMYVLVQDQQEVVAYASYRIIDTTLIIRDFCALTDDGRKALWRFFASHASNVFQITGTTTIDHPVSLEFQDPRIAMQIELNTMIRIIAVQAFLVDLIQGIAPKHDFVLRIRDDQIPENDGDYLLTLSSVNKQANAFADPKAVSLSIQELAKFTMGVRTRQEIIDRFAKHPDWRDYLLQLKAEWPLAHFLEDF